MMSSIGTSSKVFGESAA